MSTPYWTRVIANAKKRKAKGQVPFTKEHIKKASNWVECACGKQDPRIQRFAGLGNPVDVRLQYLGDSFYAYVKSQWVEEAEETLKRIEVRAAELIAEYEAAKHAE